MMLRRVLSYLVFALVFSAFGAAAIDYVIFVYRLRQGTALSVVNVHQYLATPLKNGRDELDYLGEIDQPCVRALMPHQKMKPCWWINLHKEHWTQS